MTNLFRTPPPPELSALVEGFYLCEEETKPHTRERRLPDGSMNLVISLRSETIRMYDRRQPSQIHSCGGGVLSGAHSEFSVLDTAHLVSTINVHFKPGGTLPFLPLPANELCNQVVSLEALWGVAAVDLREQVLEADTPEARFHVIERFLLARLAGSRTQHPAVSFALRAFRRVRGQVLVAQEDQPLPPEPDVHAFHASGSPGSPASLCSELHRQVCQVR